MKMYQIIWPETRLVDAAQLARWASDDLYNEDGVERAPETIDVEEAIEILQSTGSVTFANQRRGLSMTEMEEREGRG